MNCLEKPSANFQLNVRVLAMLDLAIATLHKPAAINIFFYGYYNGGI